MEPALVLLAVVVLSILLWLRGSEPDEPTADEWLAAHVCAGCKAPSCAGCALAIRDAVR